MRYKVGKPRGQGGFGRVDEVEGDDGCLYAQKTFSIDANKYPSPAVVENIRARFVKEAKYQANLRHKHIVPVTESFLDYDPPSYIMPLAEASLEEDKDKGIVNGNNFLEPLLDILAGLEEMHNMDIYHRDLKPGNVLRFLDDKGNSFYAISDFGLMSRKETNVAAITMTGTRKDSDLYTAPEITLDLKNATAQSDIFSIGCIIHDFVGTGSRVPLHEIDNDTSPYSDIIQICTRKDPTKRFKNIEQLRDSLALIGVVPAKRGESEILSKLREKDYTLNDKDIDSLADMLTGVKSNDEKEEAFELIDLEHIKAIRSGPAILFKKIACAYAEYVKEGSFDFSYCDAVANRMLTFITGAPIQVQADGAMALLLMGTSHNRWYVERKFVSLIRGNADENFIKRMCLEFRLEDRRVCHSLNHLRNSISFSNTEMHPLLQSTVSQLCP